MAPALQVDDYYSCYLLRRCPERAVHFPLQRLRWKKTHLVLYVLQLHLWCICFKGMAASVCLQPWLPLFHVLHLQRCLIVNASTDTSLLAALVASGALFMLAECMLCSVSCSVHWVAECIVVAKCHCVD
jgi:hypothetical protein